MSNRFLTTKYTVKKVTYDIGENKGYIAQVLGVDEDGDLMLSIRFPDDYCSYDEDSLCKAARFFSDLADALHVVNNQEDPVVSDQARKSVQDY